MSIGDWIEAGRTGGFSRLLMSPNLLIVNLLGWILMWEIEKGEGVWVVPPPKLGGNLNSIRSLAINQSDIESKAIEKCKFSIVDRVIWLMLNGGGTLGFEIPQDQLFVINY